MKCVQGHEMSVQTYHYDAKDGGLSAVDWYCGECKQAYNIPMEKKDEKK